MVLTFHEKIKGDVTKVDPFDSWNTLIDDYVDWYKIKHNIIE